MLDKICNKIAYKQLHTPINPNKVAKRIIRDEKLGLITHYPNGVMGYDIQKATALDIKKRIIFKMVAIPAAMIIAKISSDLTD